MDLTVKTLQVLSAVPYLLQGVGMTLIITFFALMIGAFVGLLLGMARVYGGRISNRFAVAYSRLIRSLPLLVILFMLYYASSSVLNMSTFAAIVLALAVHTSAYQLEIFRGAIQSIGKGQMEAGLAIGMNKLQCVLTVILPQALRRSLPYWANEAAIVLKDSSIAYVLGIAELMRRGEYVSARTSKPFLTYVIVGFIYFILTFILTRSLLHAEKKLRIPG
jgi:polar amino acid transport system permease protein